MHGTSPRATLPSNLPVAHRQRPSFGVSPWKAGSVEGSFTNMESLMYRGSFEEVPKTKAATGGSRKQDRFVVL